MHSIVHSIAVGIALFATVVLGDTGSSTTTNLVTINNPIANQVLTPSQQFTVQYTVNGINKNNSNSQQEIPNYPNSMDVIFRWSEKNNTQSAPIEFIALNGLNTDPYPTGLKNQVYSHRWKLPNCHFFRRYMPSEWSFSLIFQFKYPEIKNNTTPFVVSTANDNANKQHTVAVVPLGPEQSSMTVPIDIFFNATLMADHHKGC